MEDRWVDGETRWYLLNKERLDKEYEDQRRLNDIAHERLYAQWREEDEKEAQEKQRQQGNAK